MEQSLKHFFESSMLRTEEYREVTSKKGGKVREKLYLGSGEYFYKEGVGF